jgi:hypothetical protein
VEICSQTDARSIWTFVKRGLVGLVLSREIDDLVVARSEFDVAHHSAAARAFAFDMQCEGGDSRFLLRMVHRPKPESMSSTVIFTRETPESELSALHT